MSPVLGNWLYPTQLLLGLGRKRRWGFRLGTEKLYSVKNKFKMVLTEEFVETAAAELRWLSCVLPDGFFLSWPLGIWSFSPHHNSPTVQPTLLVEDTPAHPTRFTFLGETRLCDAGRQHPLLKRNGTHFIGTAKMKYVLKSVLQINSHINCPFAARKPSFFFSFVCVWGAVRGP